MHRAWHVTLPPLVLFANVEQNQIFPRLEAVFEVLQRDLADRAFDLLQHVCICLGHARQYVTWGSFVKANGVLADILWFSHRFCRV